MPEWSEFRITVDAFRADYVNGKFEPLAKSIEEAQKDFDRYRKHAQLPEIKIKNPGIGILGLFIAMLKAEKDKNCPRIDFVDRYEYKAPDKDIEP